MKFVVIVLCALVLCLGCGDDEPIPTDTPAGGVIGQWAYQTNGGYSILTLYKNINNTYFQEEFPDGSAFLVEIIEVESGSNKERRFNEVNSADGKYYVIDRDRNLVVYNSQGEILKAFPQ